MVTGGMEIDQYIIERRGKKVGYEYVERGISGRMAVLEIATEIIGYQAKCSILYHPDSMKLWSFRKTILEHPINKEFLVEWKDEESAYARHGSGRIIVSGMVFALGQIRYLLPAIFRKNQRDYLVCDCASEKLLFYRLYQVSDGRFQIRVPETAFLQYEDDRLVWYDNQAGRIRAYIAD
jgi:hypothetical protein